MSNRMNDKDIREVLINHIGETPGLLVEELGILYGTSRADLAVISTDSLIGIEIKSDVDRVNRFGKQQIAYSKVFTKCIIACGESKLEWAVSQDEKWGVICVSSAGIQVIRQAVRNTGQCVESMLMLLWRNEMINELGKLGANRLSRKTRYELLPMLAASVSAETACGLIYTNMTQRNGWRGGNGHGDNEQHNG